MNPNIKIVHDQPRGCGLRHKLGALYFVSDNPGIPCGVLPLELKPCPTCTAMGLKCRTAPTRGFTWIDPSKLFDWKIVSCGRNPDGGLCRDCPMSFIAHSSHCGLLWVGERYYATPDDFDKEASNQGISRRIRHDQLPRGFVVGQDFIMLAHRKVVLRMSVEGEGSMFDYFPGVFRIFKPNRVEVLCDGTETDEEIEAYLKRGLTPVKVERAS